MAYPKTESALWLKLLELPLDRLAEEPAPAFGFVKRLMRDEKWDYATAIRVAAEYRRFLLLAHLGPVSPPPMVDAAWHLHLTYTRAYNVGLCERTFGHALDHDPSGSASDTARFSLVYDGTRNRYREVFGEEPPADIWPPVAAATPKKRNPKGAGIVAGIAGVLAVCMIVGRSFALIIPMIFLLIAAANVYAGTPGRRKGRGSDSGCGSACGSVSDGSGDGGCGSSCGGGCGGGGD